MRWIEKEEDYVDTDWVVDKLKNGSCVYCSEPFDLSGGVAGFSVDRIDGDLAHVKTNCQVCCLVCSSIKR